MQTETITTKGQGRGKTQDLTPAPEGAQADIKAAMDNHPDVPHVKVEDGKGRRLGRTFGVKLWPTLIFLKDGKEIARVVRPEGSSDIEDALLKIH